MALSIAIAGAGIGGLTAALALADAGHEVTLIERRTGFDAGGAGIQLSPNASRILFKLGLGAALRRAGTEPPGITVQALATGRVIGAVALGEAIRERYGAPYLVIHRGDLQTLLLDAIRARPGIRLLMAREAQRVDQSGGRAVLTVARANGAEEEADFDLAIGADGLWSRMREAAGDRRQPVHQGFSAWRAQVPAEAVPQALRDGATGLWLSPHGHVVAYPIAQGQVYNVVVVARRAEPVDGWGTPADPAEFLSLFGRMAPDLRTLLESAPEWRLWSLHGLPVRRMAYGRLALIGDAAHPVLPFLAQGGALAIEDAAVLAASLAARSDATEGLRAFERARLSRVRAVQKAAEATGRAYHAGGLKAFARDRVIRALGPERMAARQDWIWRWTA